MSIYKRNGVYWFHFWLDGAHVQVSTKQGNAQLARQLEANHRTKLIKGEAGLTRKPPAPTLKEFSKWFEDYLCVHLADRQETARFYRSKLARLLEYAPLANTRLSDIDETLVEAYTQHRHKKRRSRASINRELATLRRILHLAKAQKLINSVPSIKLLKGERKRTFVLSHEQEAAYLDACPQPLRDVAVLVLNTGLRVGELIALQPRDIYLDEHPYLHVGRGKSENAVRDIPLTPAALTVLVRRMDGDWIFPGKPGKPFLATSLNGQHSRVRKDLNLPRDFVIHSLRHTHITRLAGHTDAFTLMKLAGHSSVSVSQRYVHPGREAMRAAIEQLRRNDEAATVSATLPEAVSEKVM